MMRPDALYPNTVFSVGDVVRCNWKRRDRWWSGVIKIANPASNDYAVFFNDGDWEEHIASDRLYRVFVAGDAVVAHTPTGSRDAVVVTDPGSHVHTGAVGFDSDRYVVQFADGTTAECAPTQMTRPWRMPALREWCVRVASERSVNSPRLPQWVQVEIEWRNEQQSKPVYKVGDRVRCWRSMNQWCAGRGAWCVGSGADDSWATAGWRDAWWQQPPTGRTR
eukprot:TRINITY_DN2435_c0_g1_i3.p3 TRINITY_DN2435_c0_g1~~TRINITY_DN2435_c0_g1_i3.p3  ORF type:complete len:248 (-),score=41.77 TRINITY_DN2435_c0_g1_i3:409-1071(-)